MKAAVIATIILVVLFGGAAYLAAAGTLIIYALGNNKATKGKRTFFGILGAVAGAIGTAIAAGFFH